MATIKTFNDFLTESKIFENIDTKGMSDEQKKTVKSLYNTIKDYNDVLLGDSDETIYKKGILISSEGIPVIDILDGIDAKYIVVSPKTEIDSKSVVNALLWGNNQFVVFDGCDGLFESEIIVSIFKNVLEDGTINSPETKYKGLFKGVVIFNNVSLGSDKTQSQAMKSRLKVY